MATLDEQILTAVREIPGIAVLVVFGSRARGTPRPDSDLDVAVLPESADSRERWHLQAKIAVALADLAPEGRVDVVPLDEANAVLRQRIMETGRVLLCRDPETWKELRVRTMRESDDLEWERQRFREAQRRRLKRGEPRGRSALEGSLAELRPFREVSREEFVREPRMHHLAERYLHIACESILQIAHNAMLDRGCSHAASYGEAIEVLAEIRLIDRDLAERLKEWSGLRNDLSHVYMGMDHGRTYDAIQEDLGDLEAFAAQMA